jgi:hypothetical protein
MNSTIRQFSKPKESDSTSRGNTKANALPLQAKKFAQQMGLDLTGLEAEAEDVWEMLNKMSIENPLEYEQFVGQQLQEGKLQDKEGGGAGGRMIRPKAGFCISCRTTGNDGIKIRDTGKNSGKDFYINFCSHEAIEPPKDRTGRPILDDRLSADGLEIPLVISDKRDINDNTALAIDVLVHPVIISRCQSHNIFRSQVVDLGLEWVASECPVLFHRRYQFHHDREYVGGRGVEKDMPVLLSVDNIIAKQEGRDPASSSTGSSSGAAGAGASSGSSLLNSIKQAKFGDGTHFDSEDEDDKPSLRIVSPLLSVHPLTLCLPLSPLTGPSLKSWKTQELHSINRRDRCCPPLLFAFNCSTHKPSQATEELHRSSAHQKRFPEQVDPVVSRGIQ